MCYCHYIANLLLQRPLSLPLVSSFKKQQHYNDIMSAQATQITSRTIVYSTAYASTVQRKHQSSASLRASKAPVTHVLQPVGDCLATKKQLQPMQPLCDQKLRFSVADQSATGRRQLSLEIGQWLSAISRGAIGNRLAIGRRLYLERCFWLHKLCNFLEIGRQPIGDCKLCRDCLQPLQLVWDQSPTSRRPPKTFPRSIWSQRGFTCINQNLLATKSSLQPSATGRRPCNHPATSLRPPKIVVARRSPTGCKLCVTGALRGKCFHLMTSSRQHQLPLFVFFAIIVTNINSATCIFSITRGVMCSSQFWFFNHDIKWKHFPHYWPFVRGIHCITVTS